MSGRTTVLLVMLASGCAAGAGEQPLPASPGASGVPSDPPGTPDASSDPAPHAPDDPANPGTDEEPSQEFSASDRDDERWYTPLPPTRLDSLTDDQMATQRACVETHRVQADDVTDGELLDAAMCMGEGPGVAKKILIARSLVDRFPDSEHRPAAIIAAGRGNERLERFAQAVEFYERLLRDYAKHELAPLLGRRAVCLARAAGLEDAEQALLQTLERNYGRSQGFRSPDATELTELCGE